MSTKRNLDTQGRTAVTSKKTRLEVDGFINEPQSERLHVYVFGEGAGGELGLGPSHAGKKTTDVMRPRLNPYLAVGDVGVVQVVAGGMHCVALTRDDKILTWGVNDAGALGRDTTWTGGLKNINDEHQDETDDEDDGDLNPKESIPGEVDFSDLDLAVGTRFTQVAAGDSISLALTNTGFVYGWGSFRDNEGELGFSRSTKRAVRPQLIPELKNITSIRAGANHALALDTEGKVFAWGSAQQCQLGRKLVLGRKDDVVKRRQGDCLVPRKLALPRGPINGIARIGTGAYHSFAISKIGEVYSWGLNNFGETGHTKGAGQDGAVVVTPAIIDTLRGENISTIEGGSHHSIAATEDGHCITFGRTDSGQIGISQEQLRTMSEDKVIRDGRDMPRMTAMPMRVSAIPARVIYVAADSDHNIVITEDGKAWSWGFSANYQTGLGTSDEVPIPQMIDNTAVREKKLNTASTGGQFGIVTAIA